MSLLNSITKVASISVSVLNEALGRKLNPHRIGDLYYFYDSDISGVRCLNLGTEKTLVYSRMGELGNIEFVYISLAQRGRYVASSDLSVFAKGNVSITTTDPVGTGVGRARILFSIPVLAVSAFSFFGGRYEFRVTGSGFLIKAKQATTFENAGLEYVDRSGSRFELALSPSNPPGLDEASAESPSGSTPRLPLQGVEISLEVPRESFDEVTGPRRKLVEVIDKSDVPQFLRS